jgi:hypothetical protein
VGASCAAAVTDPSSPHCYTYANTFAIAYANRIDYTNAVIYSNHRAAATVSPGNDARQRHHFGGAVYG